MNPADDIPACANQTECFAFHIDTRMTNTLDTDPTHFDGSDTTFSIPTSGGVFYSAHAYDWIIDWGDGATEIKSGSSGSSGASADGITHDYASTGNVAGEYQITILPRGAASDDWFHAFGFYYSTTGANAETNKDKFLSIDTPFTNLMRAQGSYSRFDFIFYGARNGLGIPTNLFANISTAGDTNLSGMFDSTFSDYAYNSTTATIPAGLFDFIDTSSANDLGYMFIYTFYEYAFNSAVATIPAGLFDSVDTSSAAYLDGMFFMTFYFYGQRQAQFVDDGTVIDTQAFTNPYSVKVGASGTPSDDPVLTAGDKAYPTYNVNTRTITAPTGAYTGYTWYRTDGTSCAAVNPTPDCGAQTPGGIVAFPNTTEWTPTASTEIGNVSFYNLNSTPTANPPTVTAVSPNKGLTDVSGQTITIAGTNFNNASSVTIGGEACTSFTITDDTEISCTLPSFDSTSTGPKSILVTNPDGTNSANTLYTVVVQYLSLSTSGNVPIGVNPGRFSSNLSTVTVSTNAPSGYSLRMSASSADLTRTTAPFATISTISGYSASSPASASAVSNLIGNSSFWGYRVNGLGAFGTTTVQETNADSTAYSWATIPTADTVIRAGTTTDNLTTDTPQTTDIWFGISPALNQPGGIYQVTITYSLVAGV